MEAAEYYSNKQQAAAIPQLETVKHSDFLLDRLNKLLPVLCSVKQGLGESTFSIAYPREQPTSTLSGKKEELKGDIFINKLEARLDYLESIIEELKGIAYALEGF